MGRVEPHGVGYIGALRLTPSFIYTPKACETSILTAKCQQRLLKNEKLVFPDFTPRFTVDHDEYVKDYVSCFGPVINLSYCYPGSGQGEHRTAIGRMIALRAPDTPWLNPILIRNQNCVGRHLRCALYEFKKHFESRIKRDTYSTSYPMWLMKPHAKRQLRVDQEIENTIAGTDTCDDAKDVQFKLKGKEFLSSGKKRGIGDLGAMRTSATAHVFESIKEALSGDYVYGNYTFEFVKSPDKGLLQNVFHRLLNTKTGEVYYPYFSDDCCVSAHCKDGRVYFNGDIKQCDGSHYTKMLDLVRDFFGITDGKLNCHSDAVNRAYGYLSRAACFKNTHSRRHKGEKVRYEFTSKRMLSLIHI